MKRFGNLFEQICSFENLLLAAKKAQRGKRFKHSTSEFNLNLEKNLLCLQQELMSQTYKMGGYRQFYIYDPKKRLISAAPYRDRVVQHALCNIVGPIFDKLLIDDSYACRKDKGTHKAVERFTQFSRANKFVLKCDVRNYFASIDHGILFDFIQRKIKDSKALWLIKEIIGSTPSPGIPIGNLSSQIFANLYLNQLDHYLKENTRCRYYLRYMDDLVIFENDKRRLNEVRVIIQKEMAKLKLALHENKSQIYSTHKGVSFLGYKVWADHHLVMKQNIKRFRARMKKYYRLLKVQAICRYKIFASVRSWFSYACHADSFRLRQKLAVEISAGYARGISP